MCLSRADTATNPSPLGGWNSYCSPRSLQTLLPSPRPRPSLMVRSPCLRRCFAVTQLHCSRKHHARNRVILPREHRPHASSRSIAGVSTCQPQFARARALASAVRTQPAQVRLARPRTLNALSCGTLAPHTAPFASRQSAGTPAAQPPLTRLKPPPTLHSTARR